VPALSLASVGVLEMVVARMALGSLKEISIGIHEAARVLRTHDAARVVERTRRNVPDSDLDRNGSVLDRGIERMLAGVKDYQDIHLGAEFHEIAGF
jgi:hypothetical protein